ncbi:hypothetical protein FOZ61_006532 [Perkinsus olseni]|nr:hypothetical protein FOZ61_006532 [Perkinsus olseni]
MPMAAPSALSLIKLALLSATAVWSPISAGPTFEQHYTNSFVASASVEFKDEVFRTGSEARFALVTGEKAINPNVTCESSWAKAHTLIGDERTETGKRKQHFIPRPVDYVVFERFKKCVWRATGVTRLFSAVRIDAGDGFVRIQFGVEPKRGDKLIAGFVLNIPLSKDYRVDDDGSLAPSGGGQSTGVESRLAPELGEDASEEPSACDKDEEAAVLRHSVLAGSGAVYGKGIISSAFVEFNGEVIRRGSEAFFEITTGDDAEVPDVTCESPWMRLRAFNGRMDGTGKQIRPIEYKFIPRPGDNASLEKFTLCLAEATGLPRSFEAEFNEDGIRLRGDVRLGTGTLIYKFIARPGDSTEFEAYTRCLVNATALPAFFTAELIDDANPRVKVKVGQLPNKGKRLVTGLAPEVRLSIENLVDKRRPLVEAEGVDGNEGSRAQQTDEVDGRRSNEGSHGQQTDEVDGRPLNDEGRGQLTGIGGRKMRKYVRVRPTEAPSLNGKSSGKSGKTKNGGRPSDCDRQRKHKKRSGCIIL